MSNRKPLLVYNRFAARFDAVARWATAMRNFGIPQIQSTTRILLICPDCGQENSEFADTLRRISTFYCTGEECDYIFDLAPGRRTDFGKTFVDACKRFYAAFYAPRGQRAR
jgi:hypothetical protein